MPHLFFSRVAFVISALDSIVCGSFEVPTRPSLLSTPRKRKIICHMCKASSCKLKGNLVIQMLNIQEECQTTDLKMLEQQKNHVQEDFIASKSFETSS